MSLSSDEEVPEHSNHQHSVNLETIPDPSGTTNTVNPTGFTSTVTPVEEPSSVRTRAYTIPEERRSEIIAENPPSVHSHSSYSGLVKQSVYIPTYGHLHN